MKEIKEYPMNTPIYWNSCFNGLLKGKILEINKQENLAKIKITSRNNRVYKAGEIIIVSSLFIFPRELYKRTGIFRFVVTSNYKWI